MDLNRNDDGDWIDSIRVQHCVTTDAPDQLEVAT